MSKTSTENRERARLDKRAYRSPAIEESGSFERLVLACTHTPEEEMGDPESNCLPAALDS